MTDRKTSQAQIDAVKRYKQKNSKRFCMDFYPSDTDILDHLNKQPKKQTYIKELIRRDMEKSKA